MAVNVEELLEKVRVYLRRLNAELELPTDLQNARMGLLGQIDMFFQNKFVQEDGYISRRDAGAETASLASHNTLPSSSNGTLTAVTPTQDGAGDEIEATPAASLTICTKTGVLFKRRRQEKIQRMFGPQKRWCAIKDGIFYYYVSETAKKQKGAFYLSGYQAESAPGEKENSYVFTVTSPGKRCFTFLTDTGDSMAQWISTINVLAAVGSEGRSRVADPSYSLAADYVEPTPVSPVPPPRGPSAPQPRAGVLTGPGHPGRAHLTAELNQGFSTVSVGTVYEDTEDMENQPQPGSVGKMVALPQRQGSATSAGTVYEDTTEEDARGVAAGRRSSTSSTDTYEDTDFVDDGIGPVHSADDEENPYQPFEFNPQMQIQGIPTRNNDDKIPPRSTHAVSPKPPPPRDAAAPNVRAPRPAPPQPKSSLPALPTAKKPAQPPLPTTKKPPKIQRDQSSRRDVYENLDYTRLYYSLFDCKPHEVGELSFGQGDILYVTHENSSDWWTARIGQNTGLVPAKYLAPVYRQDA